MEAERSSDVLQCGIVKQSKYKTATGKILLQIMVSVVDNAVYVIDSGILEDELFNCFQFYRYWKIGRKRKLHHVEVQYENVLEHEDLWCCVEPSDKMPVSASKDITAQANLILLLDPQN